MRELLVESDKKVNTCSIMTEQLPEVTWKIMYLMNLWT